MIRSTLYQSTVAESEEVIIKMLVNSCFSDFSLGIERLLLNDKTPGFLATGGDEFNPGPETRLDRSELLCNKVLLKYKGDRQSF